MKKEDLIEIGLTEEQADKVLKGINKDYASKSEFKELNDKLKTANEALEALKQNNQDNEALQTEVESYKNKVKELETAAANTKKEYALKEKLQAAGVVDSEYVIYKQGGLDKFNFDKDGKPVGIDDILKPLKEASPHLFKVENSGGYNPAAGGRPAVNNPFAKETYNMTEQSRMLRDNPEQARQMAAAAGVSI